MNDSSLIEYDELTNEEIRSKFAALGHPVGPILPTTRRILLKKLKTLLENPDSSSVNDSNSTKNKSRSGSKSPRRRSPARIGAPSANSTFVESSSNDRTSSVPRSRRSTDPRSNVASSIPDVAQPIISNTNSKKTNQTPTRTVTVQHQFGLGINDAFRSRFESASGGNNSRPAESSPISSSSQVFVSDFFKRLSSSRPNHRMNMATDSGSHLSSLLDVKESDDEDSGPPPVYTRVIQGRSKGFDITHGKSKVRLPASDSGFALDSPISAVLLVLIILFFVVIGYLYIRIEPVETSTFPSIGKEFKFPRCSEANRNVGEFNCIEPSEESSIERIYSALLKDINERITDISCTNFKPPQQSFHMNDGDIVSAVIKQDRTISSFIVDSYLPQLKLFMGHNPKMNIAPNDNGITINVTSRLSYFCLFVSWLAYVVDWTTRIAVALFCIFLVYFLSRWWMRRQALQKEEVYKLASDIVDVVSSRAQGSSDALVPIGHVRDQLVPLKDRAKMKKLWDEAVALLQNDSRIREEIQDVDGEEFRAWRWLASVNSQNNKKKIWQGQAFDTFEGSVNSLQHSPTSYLKVRHMFVADQEEGDEWVTTIVNAVLEKCGSALITHIAVDRKSREGCVYMKCASTADAGKAYRALHGSWFASNLVTVKYIRESRYLERFPESKLCTMPLCPSNDHRNSLQ